MLGSGGDGGDRTGSNCGDVGRELRWDVVVMGEVYRTGSICGGCG